MMNMRKLSGLFAMMAAIVLPMATLAAPTAQENYRDATSATPDLARGEKLFSGCIRCHGQDGGGNVNGTVPRLAGQLPRVIIRQLVDYRHYSRIDPRMEAVAATHQLKTTQDIADLAAFAASLRARAPAGTGEGSYREQGAGIYKARCTTCHGAAGQGNEGASVPRLAGQHYAYLLRQFHDALEGRRPKLAGSHDGYLKDLDRDALQGLADALSGMGAVPPRPAGQ